MYLVFHQYTDIAFSHLNMSSVRVFLCDICIVMLFGFTFVLTEETVNSQTATDDGPKGNCSCGGFSTPTPEAGSPPLLSQTPSLVVKCDQEGDNSCKLLCNALATATKAKGPEVLCNRLKDANELKLSAFYKVCDKPWQYADMTAEEPLCCEDNKVKTCASVAKPIVADSVDAKTVM
ncbi:uncharacterized protein LOC115445119 [Manduca sexta]|uniref:uncharacterized protein LOC115445119 n=1 Tax=Manduca sexta TaxID=7130 RepID=UPI00188FD1EA|nr:uncharacterized protein LOC115445119 [Manduca sexta]